MPSIVNAKNSELIVKVCQPDKGQQERVKACKQLLVCPIVSLCRKHSTVISTNSR